MQKMRTQGKGVMTPAKKERKSVREVTVMETAASLYARPILRRRGMVVTDICGPSKYVSTLEP